MIWNIFKSKEEKAKVKRENLEKELEDFTKKYKEYFNSYAFTGRQVVIYREPEIKDGKLIINYITESTTQGYTNYYGLWRIQAMYGEDFIKQHRINFLRLKNQFERLGLKIEKIKQ